MAFSHFMLYLTGYDTTELNMKYIAAATLVGLGMSLTPAAYSDTIFGIYVGGGALNYDLEGDFTDLENGGSSIDFESDLGLEGESGTYVYVAIEHPVPFLPNIKLAVSDITETANTTLDSSIEFDGETFPAGSNVRTEIDLSHTDITLYYEILDNWANLDLGFTAKIFDGELTASGSFGPTTYYAEESLDFTAPLLYAKAQFDLPLTGLYVSAEGNWIGAGGINFFDLWGRVGYTFAFGLGVEAGVRKLTLELDDVEDLDADLSLNGTYLAATFHF